MNSRYSSLKLTVFFVISAVISVSLCLFTAGCNDGGDNGGDSYIIRFTVDGTEYSFTKGYNDINGNPEGALDDTSITPVYTFFAAVPSGAVNTDEYVMICIYFSSSLNETDGCIGEHEPVIVFQSAIDGTIYNDDTTVQDFEVTVDQNSPDIGGTIEGTFQGTLDGGVSLTDGYFRVERVADNTFDRSDGYSGMPNPLP